MKLQATIVVSFQAPTLRDAGATLDDVLAAARARDDVAVDSVELHTPTGAVPVTLPPVSAAAPPPAHVPHPLPG